MPTITGTNNGETLNGTAGDDQIFGLGGNDILIGGLGNDTTDGGKGNDQHVVDSAGDIVVERAGEGDDEVITSVSYSLGDGTWVETLRTADASSTLALSLTGNEIAQSIYGNAGNNVLNGGGGNDYLVGLEGNDYLIGGGGADAMLGGTGNDTYTIDLAVGDQVSIQEAFGFATATVVDVGDGQTITVAQSSGGGGTVTRTVQVGQVFAGDTILENAGEGEDVVVASTSYALRANLSVELLIAASGVAGVTLQGNNLANSIYGNDGNNRLDGGFGDDYLVGLGGDDNLLGGPGRDFLEGGAGNDQLDGGNEIDTMAGGSGNDEYFVNDVGEAVIENVGEGFDVVRVGAPFNSLASFVLAPGMEIEAIVANGFSSTQYRIQGNELTQSIVGGDSFDIFWSGGGADSLEGRGGDDTYYLSDGQETIIEAANGGTDAVFTSVDFTLNAGAQVEILSTYWQFGDQDFDLTGNEFGQRIYGNFGSNLLDGKGGSDTLFGFGGADTFAFTTALGASNVDTIHDFEAGIDTIALDHAIFTALAPGDLDPNALAIGTAAADADDRIIYDPATGRLFYDADGSGAGAAVQFATLTNGPDVHATDFSVI